MRLLKAHVVELNQGVGSRREARWPPGHSFRHIRIGQLQRLEVQIRIGGGREFRRDEAWVGPSGRVLQRDVDGFCRRGDGELQILAFLILLIPVKKNLKKFSRFSRIKRLISKSIF